MIRHSGKGINSTGPENRSVVARARGALSYSEALRILGGDINVLCLDSAAGYGPYIKHIKLYTKMGSFYSI